MASTVRGTRRTGLERSCAPRRDDHVRSRDLGDGVQALRAWFAGRGFDPHRHDTYAIGVTDTGVQAFDYRGATRISTPGQVVVLHPDETHDGRAGTPAGFGYHIVYVAPRRIEEATRAIRGGPGPLPFVRDPVMRNARLASAVAAAFTVESEPLAVDDLVTRLAGALLDADPSSGGRAPARVDARAVMRARRLLDAETDRVVRAAELESVTGLSRYELARQFRAAQGTSPYRYSLLRRLDRARQLVGHGQPLAEVALATGFADQAHLTRMFHAAFGVSPARHRALMGRRP
jgi:AraC-like DNA-binding protein